MASVTLSPTGASGWSSSGNVTASDNSVASTSVGSQSASATLTVSFPGAGINATDVIDSIQVDVEGRASAASSIFLAGSNGGVVFPGGTKKTNSTIWTTSDAVYSVTHDGSPATSDYNSPWSLTIRVENGHFTSSRTALIDYVSVTITYHAGTVTHDAAAALTLAPTITTTAVRQVNGAAALNLAPTITATAQREAVASATLALAATITASAQLELSAAAALNLAPAITAAAVRETQAAAALDWSGTITASAIVVGSDVMHASLTLEPTITVAAVRETDASADLSLDATITADAVVIVTASATLVLEPTITVRAVIKTSAVVLHAIVYGSARETQSVAGSPHALSATGSAHVVPTVAGAPHTIGERVGTARQIAIMKGSRA